MQMQQFMAFYPAMLWQKSWTAIANGYKNTLCNFESSVIMAVLFDHFFKEGVKKGKKICGWK